MGRPADLPCDTSSSDPADQATLVLWYKDGESIPMYSFDGRGGRPLADRTVGAPPPRDVLFVTHMERSALRLAAVAAHDEGQYRCRVDFRNSQTRNYRINLTVIVPPERPIILYNTRTVTGRIGPLQEDEPLELVCLSQGGRPAPRVRWFRGSRLLDGTDRSAGAGQVTNELRLPPLGRSDLDTRLVCAASNNNISQPAVNDVHLDIYFRPLSVEILGSAAAAFSAGKTYHLVCRTFGSRPAANITWWIGNRQLGGHSQAVSNGGNITSSKLPFQPAVEDDGKQLTCRAENAMVSAGTLEDQRALNVRYAPVVTLQLGSALRADDIKEGADVYFDCSISANPVVYSVIWYHDGIQLSPGSQEAGTSDRVDTSDRNLVIRNVSRHSTGAYVCKASNQEGDGASRPVMLSVKYAPVCLPGQKIRYGAARGETAQVMCKVDANPPDVAYKWQFNNSIKVFDLSYSQVRSRGMESRASYTPRTENDYGTLLCRADNSIGRMVEPCVFELVAAGRPDPLRNCSVINQTSHSLEVECRAGFDGGLPQYFVAELFDQTGQELLRNFTRPFPDFAVAELPAGLELRLELYAANSRGRSRAVTLHGFTLKMPEKGASMGDSGATAQPPFVVTPILGVLIGLVATLIILAIGAVACIRNRSGRSRKAASEAERSPACSAPVKAGSCPGSEADTEPDSAQLRPLANSLTKAFDADELNPDVVPSVHDPGYEVTEGTIMLNHITDDIKKNNAPPPVRPKPKPIRANIYQDDVTYAELTLPRSGQQGKQCRPRASPASGVIYASIDHGKSVSLGPHTASARSVLLNNQNETVV
ncbi:nephrin-like [Amphibalanus amphitrite]|uniref:nephrin-like n=1 Tax=Amphibalanus amphitrite TaxID=1232801 RepID=UPI001C91DB4F|nr:nephrin-like [Amphibalanus amphitrite]